MTGLLAQGLQGVAVAAFDTRIVPKETISGFLRLMIKLFGYAAKPLASGMQSQGERLAPPPEGFRVLGSEGGLAEGELERAAAWAREALAKAVG
ncbi:MAG: hypothetical protein JXA74_07255 [Anaerolineae bacterium]|nr:hypothetical protein [Anaerolineae bacterium]